MTRTSWNLAEIYDRHAAWVAQQTPQDAARHAAACGLVAIEEMRKGYSPYSAAKTAGSWARIALGEQ